MNSIAATTKAVTPAKAIQLAQNQAPSTAGTLDHRAWCVENACHQTDVGLLHVGDALSVDYRLAVGGLFVVAWDDEESPRIRLGLVHKEVEEEITLDLSVREALNLVQLLIEAVGLTGESS